MPDQRGRPLVAALGFAGLRRPSYDRALWALRFWLDSWRGIGAVERGMARRGYDLQLIQYDCARLARHLIHDRNSILFGMSTALVDESIVFFKHEDSGSGPALARRFLALREGSTEVNVR